MRARLRSLLALKNWTQLDLARRLGYPPSTLSSYLHGVAPAPIDLVVRIEGALKLPAGALLAAKSDFVNLTPEPTPQPRAVDAGGTQVETNYTKEDKSG